jgi:hypothetical protein
MSKVKPWFIGIAAEAFVAGMFARCGYKVSVQYGANQPEYDLMIEKNDKIMKLSVKGSQDGGWGLTQSFKKGNDYFEASKIWAESHGNKTVLCLVQFKDVDLTELPRIYLAQPKDIKEALDKSRKGNGETVLREYHEWKRGIGSGTIDKIPENWKFSIERIENLLFELIKEEIK